MTFQLFLSLIPEREIISKHSKRSNTLCGVTLTSIFDLSFWDVKNTIPDMLEEGKYDEVFHKLISNKKKIKFARIEKVNNFKKFEFYMWLLDQYEAINNLERTQLNSVVDQKLINAGIKRMEVLGYFPLIDAIARDYNYTHEEVKNLSYETVFEIQLKNKIEADINKKLAEINKT